MASFNDLKKWLEKLDYEGPTGNTEQMKEHLKGVVEKSKRTMASATWDHTYYDAEAVAETARCCVLVVMKWERDQTLPLPEPPKANWKITDLKNHLLSELGVEIP